MPKLLNLDEWVKQINEMIKRLQQLDCDKCIGEFMDKQITNNIISEWSYQDSELFIEYVISGKTQRVEL